MRVMYSCKLCGRSPLERSVPFGYKIALPLFPSIVRNNDADEEGCCRYLEVGLSTMPLLGTDRNDIVVKLSDAFGHCTVRRGSEITLEMKEWEEIMDLREHIDRYFANVPVIQRYMLSDDLVMYFDSHNEKKCVFLMRENHEKRATDTTAAAAATATTTTTTTIIRIPEHTISFLFALSGFIKALYDRYLLKVPYTCYVFEKFLHIICSSSTTTLEMLEKVWKKDEEKCAELVQKYIRNHWFFDETSVTHNELIDLCSKDIVEIIFKEK